MLFFISMFIAVTVFFALKCLLVSVLIYGLGFANFLKIQCLQTLPIVKCEPRMNKFVLYFQVSLPWK